MRMDKDLDHLFGTARKHRLSVGEKEEIFRRLKVAIACKQAAAYEGSLLWRLLSGTFAHYTPVIATVMILVLMGGGAALAQNTIPGDFLYPLKRVQERIHSTVRITAESKAHVEATHMERRMDEATTLQVRGELTEEASVELDNEYRRERREAMKNVKVLEGAGNAQAAATLRARMNATEDRYERLFKRGRAREPNGGMDDEKDSFPAVNGASSSTEAGAAIDADARL